MACKEKLCIKVTGLRVSQNGASKRESIITILVKAVHGSVHGRTNHYILSFLAICFVSSSESKRRASQTIYLRTKNLTATSVGQSLSAVSGAWLSLGQHLNSAFRKKLLR